MNPIASAFQLLNYFYLHRQQNLKLILNRYFKKNPGPYLQKTTRLVYGIIRQEKKLDRVIASFSRKGMKKISSENLILLRMGIFLLLFSRSTPDYAVVNEIVSLGREGSRGFLNAMLRNTARNRESLKTGFQHIPELEIRYSISPFLIDNLKRISGNLEKDLEYLDQEPLFHLRANTAVLSWERFRELICQEPVEARELRDFQCFEIKNPGKIRESILEKHYGYLQNTGSQLVAMIAAEFARKSVLDCCAAPGSKSMTLQLLNPGLRVVANDISEKRMAIMKRFHCQNRIAEKSWLVSDIRTPAVKNRFDLVLVDAPCSSSGTLRKNPDLKLKVNARSIRHQAENQRRILESVFSTFASTLILYAVCSFIGEESEKLIDTIAREKNPAFSLEPLDLSPVLDQYGFQYLKSSWGVYLLPDPELNNDLFYLSLLKSRGAL